MLGLLVLLLFAPPTPAPGAGLPPLHPRLIRGLPRVIYRPVTDARYPGYVRLQPLIFVWSGPRKGEYTAPGVWGLRSRLRYRWLAFRDPDTGRVLPYPDYYFAR